MFEGIKIKDELLKHKVKFSKPEDAVLQEVHKILAAQAFKEQNILNNLKSYNKTFGMLDEEGLDKHYLFTAAELKQLSVRLRLKLLDSQCYRFDVPYEAILKIKHLNDTQKKDLESFKIMGASEAFRRKGSKANFVLFAPTVYGNYYMVHDWGEEFKWYKKILAFPLRSFEALALTLILFTLVVTLCLPTFLITLDWTATYWSGYRIGTYFHLLIFFSGISAYFLVGFNKQFSGSIWQEEKDYG